METFHKGLYISAQSALHGLFSNQSEYQKPTHSFFCEYKLYRLCRKYGIEIKTNTKIGPGFVMVHPYNITISPQAVLGENVNILKGATIGVSWGKKP